MSESFSLPGNRLLSYLRTLEATKKGLPYGLPVCVVTSHTITNTDALIQIASSIGPHIAILKVFADIIDDWSDETVHQLLALAREHSFLIWEGGRILNSTVDVTAKRNSESKDGNELVDLVRKKYTKGVIKPATWASIATAWASGVAEDNQEADIMIPALKAAARETVANTMQTIRTEITAEQLPTGDHGSVSAHNTATEDDSHKNLTSDYVVVDEESLGPPQRKASTISLTHTITQHTEDSAEVSSIKSDKPEGGDEHLTVDGIPKRPSITPDDAEVMPPPLLARGLVLCLPSENTDAFTAEYRRSCVAAARANQDFVIGFLSSGQWHAVSQRDDLFDDETPRDAGGQTEPIHLNEWDEDKPYHLAVFSLISHRLGHMHGKHLSDYTSEDSNDEPAGPTTPIVNTSPPDDKFNPLASKLESIVGRALKFREATSNDTINGPSNGDKTRNRSPRVIHVPLVSLP